MDLLLFLLTGLGIYTLAYLLGADETKNKVFTNREQSALSIAVGLGILLTGTVFSGKESFFSYAASTIAGILVAARAGRRPILYGYLTNVFIFAIASLRWQMQSQQFPMDIGSILGSFVFLHVVSFFLTLPTVILYPIWERRRKRLIQEQQASAVAVTRRISNQDSSTKTTVLPSHPAPSAVRSPIAEGNPAEQLLTRR